MTLTPLEKLIYLALAFGTVFCGGWAYETLHWVTQ